MLAKRVSILVVMICSVFTAATTAYGQAAKQKGFQYAEKKKQAPSAITVVRDEEGRPVKIWQLSKNGTPSTRRGFLQVSVEQITLYSNGRMRLTCMIRNMSDNAAPLTLNFAQSYLADKDGEAYSSIERELTGDKEGSADVELRAGTNTRYWVEFDAPKKPTLAFKVLIATNYHPLKMHTSQNEFPPFVIQLKEPISAAVAPAEEDPKGEEAKGKSMTKGKVAATASDAEPAARVTLARNARFEGTSGKNDEDEVRTVLVLTPDSDDEEGVKAEVFPKKSPTTKTLLEGWIVPDVDNPSKVQLKLKGTGVTYRLTFDGKTLSGTDSKGVKHTFRPVAK